MKFKRKANTLKKTIYTVLIMWIFVFVSHTPGYAREYQFTDMHLHYVSFVSETQGFKNLFMEMDKNGIKRTMVFGLGYAISWPDIRPERVTYYATEATGADHTPPMYFSKVGDYKLLRDYAALPEERQKQAYPLLQGLNVMDRNEIYYVLDMFKHHPELCGIGELLIHKGVMNNVTPLTPEGNSFAMAPVFDFAAANGLPVLFHQNISDEKSSGPENQLDQIYMKEITDILLRHPDTTFIWAHTGISRNLFVKDHLTVIERLLNAHPNLYFDLSWFVWDAYIKEDLDNWAKLAIKFPDRFMLGSDKIGNFSVHPIPGKRPQKYTSRKHMSARTSDTGVGDEIKKYIPLLERIDALYGGTEIADNLAYKNINRILDRIPCGCKNGKPFINPWKDGDPWKDPKYTRPTMQMSVKDDGPISVSVNTNYENLAEDIKNKYYRWDKEYQYTGVVEAIDFPGNPSGLPRFGVAVFTAPEFKQYADIRETSGQEPFPAESILFITHWSEAFLYKNSGKKLYPNGNWPTLPWWDSGSAEHGIIDKVLVPEGKTLILYADEYFRGDVLARIPWTHGKFVNLSDWVKKVKSFQFVPDPRK
jgi:predicted TIM-barrel fold metal-dependent hydrolase